MTLQSPTATLIPLFSSSELTGCGYPGLLDRKNRLTCAPGGSRTLDSLRARRAPYPLGQALRYDLTETILAILYRKVPHMLQAKYQPSGSGEEVV